mmetsp:Transcript_22889/g.59738  ORF Transcript_22889/g.59738 Transcript_22889/m.59738 type:complete len:211 (+) Transcript_22889:1059-1691(+)
MVAGRTSRVSGVTSISWLPGSLFTSPMKPPPVLATVTSAKQWSAVAARHSSEARFTNWFEKSSILPISSMTTRSGSPPSSSAATLVKASTWTPHFPTRGPRARGATGRASGVRDSPRSPITSKPIRFACLSAGTPASRTSSVTKPPMERPARSGVSARAAVTARTTACTHVVLPECGSPVTRTNGIAESSGVAGNGGVCEGGDPRRTTPG